MGMNVGVTVTNGLGLLGRAGRVIADSRIARFRSYRCKLRRCLIHPLAQTGPSGTHTAGEEVMFDRRRLAMQVAYEFGALGSGDHGDRVGMIGTVDQILFA